MTFSGHVPTQLCVFKTIFMCGKANSGRNEVNPGDNLIIHHKRGSIVRIWGNGHIYNARRESLMGKWYNYYRGITYFDSFYEGGKLFGLKNQLLMPIMVVYNQQHAMVVTRASKDTIIEPYHHRMPILLEKPDDFITTGKLIEIDYRRLFLIA